MQVDISQSRSRQCASFWYQTKAKSVLLTMIMIPKTHFTQNVTCSLFCGSASLQDHGTRDGTYPLGLTSGRDLFSDILSLAIKC